MQICLLEKEVRYDGTPLQPFWILKNTGVRGNALVAFTGEADVSIDHMVDQEDVLKNAPIYSPKMLHFLGEWFIDSLNEGILLQHLFTCELYEALWEQGVRKLHKRGNDIYYDGRKMSVSIATRSGVSVLMHSGINIETEGTPIPTAGLKEVGIEPRAFAQHMLERYQQQSKIWAEARVKVTPRL
ncbi:DUF366 family protein [bacterium]|nr:DUF366 family protein [bacterium]